MALFRKKVSDRELAGALIAEAGQWGLRTLSGLLDKDKSRSDLKIQRVKAYRETFDILWASTACEMGRLHKTGDSRRLFTLSVQLIEERFPAHAFGVSTAKQIISDVGDVQGRWGKIASKVVELSLPDIEFESEYRAAGMDLVAAVNYSDFLVSNFKPIWTEQSRRHG
jgi:hypothetical protein